MAIIESSNRITFIAAAVSCVTILFCLQFIHPEPYIAVRTGLKCSQCHVNMTGGGKRTDFGNIYIQRFLSSQFVSNSSGKNFSPQLSETISVGANFRVKNIIKYSYSHIDTAAVRTIANNEYLLDITEGNFYLEAKLIPNLFSFYFDQTISPNPDNREAFGLLYGLPLRGYLKTGKFLLPYGFRLWDDEIFIREVTGFTYSDPDLGAEIGFEPGNYSFSVAVTSNQVSGITAWVRRHGRLGFSWQKATDGSDIRMFGLFSGLHTGRFTLLGEIDHIELEDGLQQEAYFAELNFLLFRGLNFKMTYNLFNRNLDVPIARDGQERFTIGIESFPFQFFQLAAFYNINRFIPQNLALNQNTFTFELHFFF
ncbi:MAG: hypothetical protein IID16_07245 [Candidatus Marinimicrobia bacterium]|nr:hypothetical protein [Candidatus Neomarinimicrobiota bacterium]